MEANCLVDRTKLREVNEVFKTLFSKYKTISILRGKNKRIRK